MDTLNPLPLPTLVNDRKLAEVLSISRNVIQKARQGKGPLAGLPYIKLGGAVRYDVNTVRRYIAEHTIGGGQ